MTKIGEVISSIGRSVSAIADTLGKLADFTVEVGRAVARAGKEFIRGAIDLGIKIKNFFSRHIQRGYANAPRVRQTTTMDDLRNIHQEVSKVLRENFAEENINFLFAVKQFKEFAKHSDSKQLVQKAKEIYERYVERGSEQEINIEGNMRENITDAITNAEESLKQGKDIDKETLKQIFDNAYRVCYSLITQNYENKLKEKNLYDEFVNKYSTI